MADQDIDKLKRLTVIALFSDDRLVEQLVLKGGNALLLAYDLASRASFDLDFSMEGQFDPSELVNIADRIAFRLQQSFEPAGYVVFDVRLEAKPENLSPDLEDFWGGYSLEFRLISTAQRDKLGGDLDAMRRQAVPPRPGGRARFEIDISRHEYCVGKRPIEIDQFTVYVYTPPMLVCEKIRAICQQMPRYVKQVRKHPAPRARDFFDIHSTIVRFSMDLLAADNLELIRKMFHAKRVPLELLYDVEKEHDLHRRDWQAVIDTVDPHVQLRDFEFYFDFVVARCRELANALSL